MTAAYAKPFATTDITGCDLKNVPPSNGLNPPLDSSPQDTSELSFFKATNERGLAKTKATSEDNLPSMLLLTLPPYAALPHMYT